MSEHIGPEILDFVERRMDEARMREIQRHIDSCAECAADVAFARELREQAAAQGLRHLAPERVVALAADDETPTAEEGEHLERCGACRDELVWARRQEPLEALLPEIEAPGPEPPPRRVNERPRTVFPWRWAWGVAAAAAAAFAVVLMLPTARDSETPAPAMPPSGPSPTSPPVALAGLARLEPLPVRLTRGPAQPGFEEDRIAGLEAYQDGDFAAAAVHLRRALGARPQSDEVGLFLGSAELLQRRAHAADSVLATVATRATDAAIRAEAWWQLANARLLLERRDGALEALRPLGDGSGAHAEDARALIRSVEGAQP